MKRHVRNNQGVLLAIESTIVDCYLDDHRLDDVAALSVLRSLVLQDPPSTLPHAWLYSELVVVRSGFLDSSRDTDETVWVECLRVVMDSIRRHSCLHAGETTYLEFVASYVAA